MHKRPLCKQENGTAEYHIAHPSHSSLKQVLLCLDLRILTLKALFGPGVLYNIFKTFLTWQKNLLRRTVHSFKSSVQFSHWRIGKDLLPGCYHKSLGFSYLKHYDLSWFSSLLALEFLVLIASHAY